MLFLRYIVCTEYCLQVCDTGIEKVDIGVYSILVQGDEKMTVSPSPTPSCSNIPSLIAYGLHIIFKKNLLK